jgi:methionyl-tRNA formyltransferase
VVALFTQPDKPVGRKGVLTPPDIKKFVLEENLSIPIFQPQSLRDKEVIEEIKSLKPDFIVVAAYGKLLPKEILDIAPCINLHASLLPKYRGASPIQQALLNGDKITGVTAMLMEEGLDRGDMLLFSVTDIKDSDNAITLFEKLSDMAANLSKNVLENFDEIEPIEQFDVDASYCKKIKKEDGLVDFEDANDIYNRYRAFIVWPGIFLKSQLKLKEIGLIDAKKNYNKGEILEIKKSSIIVGCKKGKLEIFKVQPPSKKVMDAVSYIRGKRLGLGDSLF